MATHKVKSSLERRIEELDKELRMVEGDVKSLARAVHDPRKKPLPKLKTTTLSGQEPEAEPPAATAEKDRKSPNRYTRPAQKNPLTAMDGGGSRFATYLSAKGMTVGSSYSSRRDRAIQRNKAIAMVVIVVIVLYIVMKLT